MRGICLSLGSFFFLALSFGMSSKLFSLLSLFLFAKQLFLSLQAFSLLISNLVISPNPS